MTKRLSNLTPVPISELLGRSFFVPKYQRGYRWTARQVTDLLDDVLAFVEKPTGAFYCLQPIVVADSAGRCALIDGQQRLTTLSLILTYFNSRFTEEEAWNTFSMEYETRCGDSWDHVPIRSWPLFKARHVLRTLFINDTERPIT